MGTDGMDDIELLKLENKALRLQIEALTQTCEHLGSNLVKTNDELQILRRCVKLVRRATEITSGVGKVAADELEVARTIFGA